jgi:hypothetical protein
MDAQLSAPQNRDFERSARQRVLFDAPSALTQT